MLASLPCFPVVTLPLAVLFEMVRSVHPLPFKDSLPVGVIILLLSFVLLFAVGLIESDNSRHHCFKTCW